MIASEKAALSFRCCGPMPCGKHNPKSPPERTCVGNKCMAWTWNATHGDVDFGYCGLAPPFSK